MTVHVIKPSVARALRHLPAPVRVKLVAVIDGLADDPRPPGCKKLAGQPDRYRVRAAGTYRVVYEIRDDRLVIVVIRIGHRREVYRSLQALNGCWEHQATRGAGRSSGVTPATSPSAVLGR